MRGFRSLWLPGTDHAGIAVQVQVERLLASEGKNRRDMTREAFLERVWAWKREYGGAILDQMKRIGDSVDWDREYFTMDERLNRAVREAFVALWEDGLIYRGKYIVNWCPRCTTAISDLEVVHDETQGKLYHIRYPVSGSPGEFITVATTRPETMLGDTAVAVNPRDERYTHLHGKTVLLPLMNREIPIILDELAQSEFGSGAVKVTPAHDPNDFQAGLRHNLPQIDIMDDVARINENGGPYAGHDRYEARERVLHDLEQQGFLVKTTDYTVPLGKCDRCKTVIEPRLSTQWFLAVNKQPKSGGPSMAQAAIDAVKNENPAIDFTPEMYKTIYLNWMENIRDWCISRQLWWGHRIPAWHCADCKEITVARETPSKCSHCGSSHIEQDTDVLDTWFSSGLLPASPLGWPDDTADLRAFYPTTLLITGFDILFFWVARMIMMNTHFMLRTPQGGNDLHKSVPFQHVYIHALVRDADRQKMSKMKGNVLDPIEIIHQYGTDATRFTLASMASPGTDIAFNPARTEGYRAFANKIWNAARLMFMNVDKVGVESSAVSPQASGLDGFEAMTLEDHWMLSRFNRVAGEVSDELAGYRFDEAARAIYNFFWGEFCDWYLELIKPRLMSEDAAARRTCRNLMIVFEGALRLLAPIMPFISEEIWHAIYAGTPPLKSIALAPFPERNDAQVDTGAETQMAILQDLIVSVRNIRTELKIEPRLRVPIEIHCAADIRSLVEANRGALERLANVDGITFTGESLAHAPGARTTTRFEVRAIYEQKIDVAAERDRLQKELAQLTKELENKQRQLSNEQFLAKAPAHVVDGLRARAAELEGLIAKAKKGLEGLQT
jgi:valyl-tRNA synthetase